MPIEDQRSHERLEMMVPVERERAAPDMRSRKVSGRFQVVEEKTTFPDPTQIYLKQARSFPNFLPPQREIEGILGVQGVGHLFTEFVVGV